MTVPTLTSARAECFAAIALANLVREYPNKQDHVLEDDGDVLPARRLHPAFHTSFDWHSCVHMHWLLVRIRRLHPCVPQRAAIDALLETDLAPEKIGGECAYLARPGSASFERTYGWAWLLKLAAELFCSDDADARRWSTALAPLAEAFVARYLAFLPKADFPIRHGTHPNSAFGLALALDYAHRIGHAAFEALLVAKACAWYGADREAPAAWEPSGADFLSPSLMEAALMRRVLAASDYGSWLACFLPGLARREPATLFSPVTVSDRLDPQIVHLDGLNFSRAWCWRAIASGLAPTDPRATAANEAAAAHLATGIKALDAADYVGGHWLASFAALALSEEGAA
jgi:hypothetical protein